MDLPELDDDDSLSPDANAVPAADEPRDVTASLVNKVPGVLPVCGLAATMATPRLDSTSRFSACLLCGVLAVPAAAGAHAVGAAGPAPTARPAPSSQRTWRAGQAALGCTSR